jgi:tripartite-type tricarboxylate transporter receptor subunit TctC
MKLFQIDRPARMFLTLRTACAAVAVAAAGVNAPVNAQAPYPNKPVTVIIPFTPGSSQETEGRVHMNRLSEQMRQQFVIDFKPGGSTIIGLAHVAKAPADGYTLLLVSASFSLVPLRTVEMPFDPLTAFTPVSLLSKRWGLVVIHPSMPATVNEFVAYAKANPGKVNFATNGVGSQQHLTGAWMADVSRTDMTFVHYKSAAQIIPDLLSGRVHLTPVTLTTGIPHIKSGKLKALGMANLVRNPAFPDIPTLAEQGLKDFEYSSWHGMIAPAKTPAAIINLLSAELAKVVKSPEVIKRLENETQLVGSTPAEFGRHIATETDRWRKMIKQSGIVLEE